MSNQPMETSSPITEPMQRLPGESVREAMFSAAESLFLYCSFASVALAMAVMDWIRYATHTPLSPTTMSGLALIAVAVAYWKYRKIKPQLDRFRLGSDGERFVAEVLDDLREHRYKVIHDILCDGYNIDHALIGPSGVYSVETKTRSKRDGADQKISYDGAQILVAGFAPDRDPLVQAEANARKLSDILFKQTGKRVSVKAIVLFPGWWVTTTVPQPKVWVLNPKQIFSALRGVKFALSDEEVQAIYQGLKHHQDTEQRIRAIKNDQ